MLNIMVFTLCGNKDLVQTVGYHSTFQTKGLPRELVGIWDEGPSLETSNFYFAKVVSGSFDTFAIKKFAQTGNFQPYSARSILVDSMVLFNRSSPQAGFRQVEQPFIFRARINRPFEND